MLIYEYSIWQLETYKTYKNETHEKINNWIFLTLRS